MTKNIQESSFSDMLDKNAILSGEQACVREQVADIMDRIACVVEDSTMSDPVFAAWMLRCIQAATDNGLSARVTNGLIQRVEEIRDDAERLREHPHYVDAETIRIFVRRPKG